MKLILVVLASCFSFKSWAGVCPALSGTYSCPYQGFNVSVGVEEKKFRGFSRYTIDYMIGTLTIQTDGKVHTIDKIAGFDKAKNFKYKAVCASSSIEFAGTGDMTDGSGKATMNGKVGQTSRGVSIQIQVKTHETQNVRLNCIKE